MIGHLRGTLLAKQPTGLLVEVQGVGYEVQVSLNTFFELPDIHQPVALFTHLSVREDAHLLYGFTSVGERQLFRELIRVSGLGPKLALNLLSGMTAADFARCVHAGDIAALVRMPGVGRKTAERLVVELRDRLGAWTPMADSMATATAAVPTLATQIGEAESALVALGYKPQDAARMISAVVPAGEIAAAPEQLIRAALKAVGQK